MQPGLKSSYRENRTAWWLAGGGFVPFAFLAIALGILGGHHPAHAVLLDAFRLYGAVILSFLGGIRWGIAILPPAAPARTLLFSVCPAIVAWSALLLPPQAGLPLMILAYCAQGAWDSLSFHSDEKLAWFAHLRVVLTLGVVLSMLVALAGLL